jgi:tetratricopeptide (TPR) repeat protein
MLLSLIRMIQAFRDYQRNVSELSQLSDRELSDIFAIRTEVAQQVANAMRVQLGVEETRSLLQRPTDNPEAYALYLQGRACWNRRTIHAFKQAITHFNQALEKDKNFARAYAGLADCYVLWSRYTGEALGENPAKTFQMADRALKLDPTLAEPHATLGMARVMFNWDWEGAEREFQAAIKLNPDAANAYHWYAVMLMFLPGRAQEALDAAKRAIDLDPAPTHHATYARILIDNGRIDDGIGHLRNQIARDPTFGPYHMWLSEAYVRKGMLREAIASAEEAVRIIPERALPTQAWVFALAGMGNEARRLLVQLEERQRQGADVRSYMALVHHALGDDESALKMLEEIVNDRGSLWSFFFSQPDWVKLHANPRYQAILRKVNLLK